MNDDPEAYIAITRLQRAYADITTRKAWRELPSLAAPDARFIYHTQNGLFEFASGAALAEAGPQMVGRFTFHILIPQNFVVSIDAGGTARGRSYLLELAEERETGAWIEVYGVYYDEYVLHHGAWLFSRREYHSHGRRVGGRLETFPLPDHSL